MTKTKSRQFIQRPVPLLARLVGLIAIAAVFASCGTDAETTTASTNTAESTDVVDTVATTEPVDEPTSVADPETATPTPSPAPTSPPAPAATSVPTQVEPTVVANQTPPELQLGSEGTSVHDIQDLLNDLIGYADLPVARIAEDGFYGPNTERAERSFEEHAELVVDGIATVDDRDQLELVVAALESSSADSAVALGDQSTFVGTWQSRLNIWNALALETPAHLVVDDHFGNRTEQATLAAEAVLGLQVDGIVEATDRAALRAAIATLRAETFVRVLHQTSRNDTQIVVKSFYENDQYCLRFIVGLAADERCTQSSHGDINTAYFVTVNGVDFIGGTANPNVSFVQVVTTSGDALTVATRQIGNTIARAWVGVVDSEPETVELLEADGTSVDELRFSLAPTDRDFFGNTIAISSPNFAHTFFIDDCRSAAPDDIVVEGTLADASINVIVIDGVGTLMISSGTATSPVDIRGSITTAAIDGDNFTISGAFTDELLDSASFVGAGSC